MTPRKLRRWAGNLAAAGLAVGLVLASCEIAARIALANRRGKEGAEVQSYTEFDSDLGWVKRPGAHARYTRTEYTVDISINSLGMRDRERTVDPPPDTQRVLALGDSFVEGYTVSADEMATRVMERTLSHPGCRVEVLNGGTAGYSTDQELIFYRKTGRSFKASTVVLFFYYNDILANASFTYSARSKPLFASHNGQLSLARPAFLSEPEPVHLARGEVKAFALRGFEGPPLVPTVGVKALEAVAPHHQHGQRPQELPDLLHQPAGDDGHVVSAVLEQGLDGCDGARRGRRLEALDAKGGQRAVVVEPQEAPLRAREPRPEPGVPEQVRGPHP